MFCIWTIQGWCQETAQPLKEFLVTALTEGTYYKLNSFQASSKQDFFTVVSQENYEEIFKQQTIGLEKVFWLGSKDRPVMPKLFQACLWNLVFQISNDGDSSVSPGNIIQCVADCTLKIIPKIYPNLLYSCLACMCHIILGGKMRYSSAFSFGLPLSLSWICPVRSIFPPNSSRMVRLKLEYALLLAAFCLAFCECCDTLPITIVLKALALSKGQAGGSWKRKCPKFISVAATG